jgi:DNA polymerase elongation subunit (family B)
MELTLALSIGYTISLMEGYVFKGGFPLKTYSQDLTLMKNTAAASGNMVQRNVAKLMLNSLYGKFGAKYHNNSTAIVDAEGLKNLETLYTINSITEIDAGISIVRYDNKPLHIAANHTSREMFDNASKLCLIAREGKMTNMAVAAAITSHARVLLYNIFLEVELKGGKVLYCDTDSVFATFPEAPFGTMFGKFE